MHNKVLVFTAYVNCKTHSEIVSTYNTYHGFSCVSATQEEKNNKLHTNKLVSRTIKIINALKLLTFFLMSAICH